MAKKLPLILSTLTLLAGSFMSMTPVWADESSGSAFSAEGPWSFDDMMVANEEIKTIIDEVCAYENTTVTNCYQRYTEVFPSIYYRLTGFENGQFQILSLDTDSDNGKNTIEYYFISENTFEKVHSKTRVDYVSGVLKKFFDPTLYTHIIDKLYIYQVESGYNPAPSDQSLYPEVFASEHTKILYSGAKTEDEESLLPVDQKGELEIDEVSFDPIYFNRLYVAYEDEKGYIHPYMYIISDCHQGGELCKMQFIAKDPSPLLVNKPTYAEGYEDGYAAGLAAGRDEGYQTGLKDGYEDGEEDGYAAGLEEGYNSGKEDGYSTGYSDGESAGYAAGSEAGYNRGYRRGKMEGFSEGYESGLEEGQMIGYDEGQNDGYTEGYDTGYTEGNAAGYAEGRSIGYAEGQDTGYSEGYDKGYNNGYNNGLASGLNAAKSDSAKVATDDSNTDDDNTTNSTGSTNSSSQTVSVELAISSTSSINLGSSLADGLSAKTAKFSTKAPDTGALTVENEPATEFPWWLGAIFMTGAGVFTWLFWPKRQKSSKNLKK